MGRDEGPYTVDINKEKTAYQDYDELNSIVRDIFFNKNSNQKPIYMDWADVEDNFVKEVSGSKYLKKSELIIAIATQVGKIASKNSIKMIQSDRNQFSQYKNRIQCWKKIHSDYEKDNEYYKEYYGENFYNPTIEYPPIIALLSLFSYAAEIMRGEDDIGASNYYKRLAGLLNIKDDELIENLGISYRKQASYFWETLNEWLEKNDGIYGIPTAKPVFKHVKYISYAISQSLLRDADRKNLRKIFENATLKINENTNLNACVDRYLNFWMLETAEPSNWIKRLWERDDTTLKEKIRESIILEFEQWKIEEAEDPDKRINRNLSMSWVLSYNDNYGQEEMTFLMTSAKILNYNEELGFKNESNKDTVKDGEKIYLEPEYDYDFSFLSPKENINIHQLFHKPFTLTAGEFFISHEAFPILVFIKNDLTKMYHEVIPSVITSSTILNKDHAVVCHKNQYDEVKFFLEKYCELGLIEVNKNAKGAIEDWHVFINVVFRNIPSEDVAENLMLLVPIIERKGVECEGGLNLTRNIWHTKNPPNVYINTDNNKSHLSFQKKENEIMTLESPESLSLYIDVIDNSSIKLGDFNNNKSLVREISFRTANNPRRLPTIDSKFICYSTNNNSLFSGNKIEDKSVSFFQGFYVNNSKEIINRDEISKYKDYKINSSFKSEVKNEDYSKAKKDIDSNSCIVRGCHVWMVSPHPQLIKEFDGQLDMMKCKECSQENPMPKSKKRKKKSLKKDNLEKNSLTYNHLKEKKDLNIREISVNDSFDGLCYLGAGSYDMLKKIVIPACKNTRPNFVIEDLINLGHIDVVRDKNHIIKEWSVSPTVINLKDSEMFLSGYRSDDLIKELDKLFYKENFILNTINQKQAPEKIFWNLENAIINKKEIEIILEKINNNREEKIYVQEKTAIKISQNLNNLSEYFKRYKKKDVMLTSDFEKFNVNNGEWEKSKLNETGAYRLKKNITQYYFYNSEELIYAQHSIVKTKAAVDAKKVIHEYNSEKKLFKCFLSAEPPGIYKRALIAESGLIPEIEGNYKIFQNVSEENALTLMSKLYN